MTGKGGDSDGVVVGWVRSINFLDRKNAFLEAQWNEDYEISKNLLFNFF